MGELYRRFCIKESGQKAYYTNNYNNHAAKARNTEKIWKWDWKVDRHVEYKI